MEAEAKVNRAVHQVAEAQGSVQSVLAGLRQGAAGDGADASPQPTPDNAANTTTPNDDGLSQVREDIRLLTQRVGGCEANIGLVRGCGCPPDQATKGEVQGLKEEVEKSHGLVKLEVQELAKQVERVDRQVQGFAQGAQNAASSSANIPQQIAKIAKAIQGGVLSDVAKAQQHLKAEVSQMLAAQVPASVPDAKAHIRREAAAAADEAVELVAKEVHDGILRVQATAQEHSTKLEEMGKALQEKARATHQQPERCDEQHFRPIVGTSAAEPASPRSARPVNTQPGGNTPVRSESALARHLERIRASSVEPMQTAARGTSQQASPVRPVPVRSGFTTVAPRAMSGINAESTSLPTRGAEEGIAPSILRIPHSLEGRVTAPPRVAIGTAIQSGATASRLPGGFEVDVLGGNGGAPVRSV